MQQKPQASRQVCKQGTRQEKMKKKQEGTRQESMPEKYHGTSEESMKEMQQETR